mmetsp:Transcript_3732/g.5656  ORF Transcript_3732/g.5656 Transcript_3732/m.5656 type:complete len:103 (+) Transcript_3732:1056-1364(+)
MCPKCRQYCQSFFNLRFVDCFYEIEAETEVGKPWLKKGQTPAETGEVVTLRFDQMEDISVWTWMKVTVATNQPEIPEEEEEEEEEIVILKSDLIAAGIEPGD